MRFSLLLAVVGVIGAGLGAAQEPPSGRPPVRRMSIALEIGQAVGGPSGSLASQLRKAGYDQPSPGGCFFVLCADPHSTPTQQGPGMAVGLTARYRARSAIAVGVGYQKVSLGGAIGYNDAFVLSDWDATTAWSAVYWMPPSSGRLSGFLGGGAAWHRLENVPRNFAVSQIGLVVDAELERSGKGRLFYYLDARVHVVPPKDVDSDGLILRPPWSHGVILLGLGLRF
jgi:hypothetical protein